MLHYLIIISTFYIVFILQPSERLDANFERSMSDAITCTSSWSQGTRQNETYVRMCITCHDAIILFLFICICYVKQEYDKKNGSVTCDEYMCPLHSIHSIYMYMSIS